MNRGFVVHGRRAPRPSPPRARQGGLTLVEVLVTVVVFAIGLLGIAYTQNQALRTSHASYLHTVAVMAASDAVERLWADACAPNPDATQAAWRDDYRDRLPDFAGSIQATEDVFRIEVRWTDLRFELPESDPDDAGSAAAGVRETVVHEVRIPAPELLHLCTEAA